MPTGFSETQPVANDQFENPKIRAMWTVLAAWVLEIRAQEFIDDPGARAFARALGNVRVADDSNLDGIATNLRDHLESVVPDVYSGALSLGLMTEEWKATAVRLLAMDVSQAIHQNLLSLHQELISLAEQHVMTLMPGTITGRSVQPTMLGHLLGGVIGPIASVRARLDAALHSLNRSPLGAGLMVGSIFPIDRERAARNLGFEGVIPNTFDAVANIEDFMAVVDTIPAAMAATGRFLRELANWVRESPNSLVLTESMTPEPSVPSLKLPVSFFSLLDSVERGARNVAGIASEWRTKEYAPLGSK